MAVEHHESDGIGEAIEELLRTGLLLGARLAERHAHAREQALHEAARHSLGQARAEQQRQRAEREQALAGLEGVFSGSWWEHAGAEDIRCAWTTARSYQHEDAHAARGVWRIADELKQRYGLDAFQTDPAALGTHPELERRTPLTSEDLARYDRELARIRAQLDGDERVPHDGMAADSLDVRRAQVDELRELIAHERARLTSESAAAQTPDQQRTREPRELAGDASPAAGAEPGYDTRARRQLLAERLAALGVDTEAVDATVLADAANANPPQMAPASGRQGVPRARVSSQARGRRQTRRLG